MHLAEETPDSVRLLAFRLAAEEFCIELRWIRQLRRWSETTALPGAPPHVLGLINLRGTIVPLIDLARRLGLRSGQEEARRVVIVCDLPRATAGLAVDAVGDILTVPAAALEPPPRTGSDRSDAVVTALALREERLIRVLDPVALTGQDSRECA
ncbi:chemotaxis protein CheW [Albidovulum sp.]